MKYFKLLLIPAIMMMVACHQKGKREGMKRNGAKTNMHRMANDKSIGKKPGSIMDIITHKPKLSMFVKLVKAAGQTDMLKKGGGAVYTQYTLFAPTNKAFEALSEKERKKLTNPENKEELTKVLKYHIIKESLSASDLEKGKAYKTSNDGEKVMISKDKGQLMINGAKIIQKDIKARNGYIFIINKVLIPENHPQ